MRKSFNQQIRRAKPILLLLKPNITTVALGYLLLVVLLLQNEINSFLAEHWGTQMSAIYSLLSTHTALNWITAILLVVCAGYSIHRLLKRKNYSWTVLCSVFAVLYLACDRYWIWAETPIVGNYRILLLVISSAFLACGCWMFWKKGKSLPLGVTEKVDDGGFSVTTASGSMQDTGWRRYAENLVEKLLNTNTKEESFAVGVSGVWGSGKTTFLGMIEDEFRGKAYLLNFNPWNSDSAEQISGDFFKLLMSRLTISSSQKRSITQYAKLLAQADVFGNHTKIVASLIGNASAPIADAKEKVAEVIGAMPCPVVVLIDDLDRLDGSEIMAVLRLVRVTANFRNLIFIVAYDKGYVTQALKGRGVEAGEEFLKKIFPLEVCLPAFESFVLANILYDELVACLGENICQQLKYYVYRGTVSHPISFYLPTFRDVKRFVNQFSLNINSFLKTDQLNEIDVADFFMLELLHYYDFDAYQLIQNNPESLLEYDCNNVEKRYAYSYMQVGSIIEDKNIEAKDAKRAQILAGFKGGVADLLYALFGDKADERGDNLLRYPTNFAKYFSYRINKDAIGLEEFKQFLELDSVDEVARRVREYCSGGVSRRAALVHHLISLKLDVNNPKQVFNAAYALLELAYYRRIDPSQTFSVLFDKSRYKELGVVPEALMRAIRSHIGKNDSWKYIQKILTNLVEFDILCNWGGEDNYTVRYASVLNYEQLKALAGENLVSALCGRRIPIQKITDYRSRFHSFLHSAVADVFSVDVIEGYDGPYSRSLLLDKLCEIYAAQDNRADLKQFFVNLDPNEEDFWLDDDYYYDYLNRNIASVFGSAYHHQDFYTFIKAAFGGQIDEVNVQLKNLRMDPIEVNASEEKVPTGIKYPML